MLWCATAREHVDRWRCRRAADLIVDLKENAMSVPFKGKVNVDIRDSVPDWSPFVPPMAPEGAPSVVYVVLDDVGFSAMGCYGGPIETPNIDQIAASGVRYTQLDTTANGSFWLVGSVQPTNRPPHGVARRGAASE
jgi:Sulfatase